MIQIDKSTAPPESTEKCQALQNAMLRVHRKLCQIYQHKKAANEIVALNSDERTVVAKVWLNDENPSKKRLSTACKQMNNLVFAEALEKHIPIAPEIYTAETLGNLGPIWAALFNPLANEFQTLRAKQYELYTAQFSQAPLLRQIATEIFAEVRYLYQLRAVRNQLNDVPGLDELAVWADAQNMEQLNPVAFCAQLFQNAIAQEFFWMQSQTGPLAEIYHSAPLAGLVGEFDERLITRSATIFDWLVGRALEAVRLNRGITDLTAEEKVALAQDEGTKGHLGYLVIGSRLFRQVMNEMTFPSEQIVARPIIGFNSDMFDSNYYSGHGIKDALKNAQHGKCVFCESKVLHIAHGDVEHFRPKAGYVQGHGFNQNGYFWQAYEWNNLFFSCQTCNQVYKKNYFPVLWNDDFYDARYGLDLDLSQELPVLIDPGQENPRDHIRFNPIDGTAYPYGLVFAVYDANRERFQEELPQYDNEIEKLLAARPEYIPPYSNPASWKIDKASGKFIESPAPVAPAPALSDFWNLMPEMPPPSAERLEDNPIVGTKPHRACPGAGSTPAAS